jgi:hypothetical protein
MGRKRPPWRLPAPSVEADPALVEAVRGALAALAAARREPTPSAIEEWLKVNQFAVWSAIRTASALKAAIEAAQREGSNGHPAGTAKEATGMGRKKKSERETSVAQPVPDPPAARADNGEEVRAPEPARRPRTKRPARTASKPASAPQAAPARQFRPARPGDYDPTRSDLLRVLAIVRQESSVSKLQKLVQTVKHLADQVGGLDRLAVCLDTLEEFGIK